MALDSLFLPEHRCHCGKLLFKGILLNSVLEIKCKRCGSLVTVDSIGDSFGNTGYTMVVGPDGKILTASHSASYILGYSPEELQSMYFRELLTVIVPDLGQRFRHSLQERLGVYFHIDTFQKKKSGQQIPVSFTFRMFQSRDKEKFILCIANTKRPKALSEPETLSLLEQGSDVFGELDTSGRFTSLSPSFKNIFGYTPGEQLGTDIFDYCVLAQRQGLNQRFSHFVANQMPFRLLDCKFISLHGEIISLDIYFSLNLDDTGSFTGYVFTGWLVDSGRVKE